MIIEGQFREYQVKYPEILISSRLYAPARNNWSWHLFYSIKEREYIVSKASYHPVLAIDINIKIISLLKL